jgi:hypothetical protein
VTDNLRSAIADYEVAISEYTTSLAGSKAKAEKLRGPEGCKCEHCASYLENLEGQIIPTTNAAIAQVRGAIAALRWQIRDMDS